MNGRAQAGDAFTLWRWWRAQDELPIDWYGGPAWDCDKEREDMERDQLDRARPTPRDCGGRGRR